MPGKPNLYETDCPKNGSTIRKKPAFAQLKAPST